MKQLIKLALAASLMWAMPLWAADFEQNVHYEEILPEPPLGKVGDKIEVIEFFMYGCPHCYHFEPELNAWLKNKAEDIEFVRVPAMFGRHNNLHAQAFYALQAMGEQERVHAAFFEVIHEQKKRLMTRDDIEAFLQDQGIDMAAFRDAWSSFAVAAKTNRATALLRRYGIRGVPTVVIDGRYKSGRGLSFKGKVELVDYLADRIRQDRQEAAQN